MKDQIRNIYPGGNTPKGFYSYYRSVLPQREAARIFCIKGGPGTGKSTLMKDVGGYFSQKGEAVDFLWCSSDPDSLDGILLKDRKVALVDGTAPHIIDPVNPGAVDEIINLGEAWNESGISIHRGDIISCNERIGETFELAYGYLRCAESQYAIMKLLLNKLIPPTVVQDYKRQLEMRLEGISAVRRSESRVMKNMALGIVSTLGRRKKSFASAITPAGVRNGLQSIVNDIDKVILLEVPLGLSTESLLAPVSERFVCAGLDVEEYYCPMDPEHKMEHIVSQDAGLAVVTCNAYHSIDADVCSGKVLKLETALREDMATDDLRRLEELQKESAKTIDKALQLLEKAKRYHDELEGYYISNMNFDKITETKQKIIDKIERM